MYEAAPGKCDDGSKCTKDDKCLEIVAIGTGVVVIVGPQVYFIELDAIIGIRVGESRSHRPVPGFTYTVYFCSGSFGGKVVTRTDIQRHLFNGLSGPGSIWQIGLIGTRPGGGQVDLYIRVLATQEVRHFRRCFNQGFRVTGGSGI